MPAWVICLSCFQALVGGISGAPAPGRQRLMLNSNCETAFAVHPCGLCPCRLSALRLFQPFRCSWHTRLPLWNGRPVRAQRLSRVLYTDASGA